MELEKKKFVRYGAEVTKKPISIKLNEKEEEMIALGQYMLNMHSKSGVFKELAEIGLKVLLDTLGAKKMHYLTRGDRTRLIYEEPRLKHFSKMVNDF